ncbi:B3 domain-containing transcription factor vrn1 [Thalictrum thalictroides]|uniref:B3 domain-containing transcription factor vrn1 n=1 Tax=Thalictrum thalictroides TaxID=46969 RepID=A0A7J6X1V0_THATH|nr:B3 domain-containing transcription factor vrn1 [Thalictrum thalictroides]
MVRKIFPSSKGRGGKQFSSPVKNRKTSFFKIIHPNIIKDQQLDLPYMFVRKHQNDFSDYVTLKVPNGNVWNVRLRKINDKFCLCDGWKDFADHHSICAGHFTTFKYKGSCRFDVMICDMSMVEIDYPCNTDDGYGHSFNKVGKGKQVISGQRPLVSAEVSLFKSSYHFFTIKLSKNYVLRNYLQLPMPFAQTYIPKTQEAVRIIDLEGRAWYLKYKFSKQHAYFNQSWNAVVQANNLREGHVCAFELISTKHLTFKLSVLNAL